MIKIGVCDDRKEDREFLINKLNNNHYPLSPFEIHEFCNAEELLNSLIDFDIIFLDIEMPNKSGLDLLFENPKHFQYSKIVLLTSHSEFSTVGYEVNAYRYLCKPVNNDKLQELFVAYKKENILNDTITIKTQSRDFTVRLRDIIYVESHRNILDIVTTTTRINTYIRLKDLKKMLPPEFFYQSHKSFIINLSHVKKIDCVEHTVIMSNGDLTELSIRNKTDVVNAFNNFLLC